MAAPARRVLIFVDGMGVGLRDGAVNPLAATGGPVFADFLDGESAPLPAGGVRARPDTTLGVTGLPQSATGQTTLFTGINAAAHLGRHLEGFPNAVLRDLLMEHSFRAIIIHRSIH